MYNVDLRFFTDWLEKLTLLTNLFEQVRIDIEQEFFKAAVVTDALSEEQCRVIRSAQDLEMFLLDRV